MQGWILLGLAAIVAAIVYFSLQQPATVAVVPATGGQAAVGK